MILVNLGVSKLTMKSDHSVWLLIIGAVFMTFGYETPPLPKNIKADPRRAKRHDLAPVTLIGLTVLFYMVSCWLINKVKTT